MDRRRFLLLGSSGLAAAALQQSIGCSRSEPIQPEPLPPPSADVAAALARARAMGKPLLILVIPFDDDLVELREGAYGRLLDEGSDALLSDLALCDVICTGVADIARAVADVPREPEPLLVLVDGDADAPRSRSIDEPIPPFELLLGPSSKSNLELRAEHHADERARISRRIHDAVAADESMIALRAEHVRRTLDAARRSEIESAARDPMACDPELADRGAALLLQRATELGKGEEARAALARVAAARLRIASPPGAKWAKDWACGVEVEGEEFTPIPCGMAMTNRDTFRFLWFYAR